MPRQKNTRVGFDLFQVATPEVIPAVRVLRINFIGPQIGTDGKPRLTTSRVGLTESYLGLSVCRLKNEQLVLRYGIASLNRFNFT